MKIVKHGKYYNTYKLKCSECGCIWTANSNEIEIAGKTLGENKTLIFYTCPECNHEAKSYKETHEIKKDDDING